MDRKKTFGVVWVMLFILWQVSINVESQQLVIEKGVTDWQIVVSGEASISEKTAGTELQKFLKEVTGVELPVVTDDNTFSKHEIMLGDNAHLRKLNVTIEFEKLGDEGFTIRTVGDHIIIAGGRLRGTMFGVWTFLEDYLGCRWFTPEVNYFDHGGHDLGDKYRNLIFPEVRDIPERDRIEIGKIDDTQVPILEYRHAYPWRNPEWCVRNKMNGNNAFWNMPKYGNFLSFSNGHTFFKFVPPEKYFNEHPEYYSEIDGKRTAESAQLCLTNPDVLRLVTEGLKKWMREDPALGGYHVSQMDWGNWCQCANCITIDKREGTPMGSILTFVNKVAEAVEKEFPDKLVFTFAYDYAGKPGVRYSQKPPKTISPRKNVVVMLAPIMACFSHPIEECERNKTLKEDIEGWSRLLGPDTGRLYILGYSANAGHNLLPLPNFHILQKNIQFYVRNGVKGIYDGAYSRHTPEVQLRTYILSKLHWDPYCDVNKVMDEYLTGYYGKSAPYIREYIELLGDKVRKDNIHCGIHTQPAGQERGTPNSSPASAYLTPEIMKKLETIFDKAESIVRDDPVLSLRVKAVRLGAIDYFKICTMQPDDPKRDRLVDSFLEVTEKLGIFYWSENGLIDEAYKESLRLKITPNRLADMGKNLFKNGGFEDWSAGADKPADGWLSGTREEKDVKEGSYAVKLFSQKRGHIFIDQHIPLGNLAGKTIVFGVWAKSSIPISVSILDWVGDNHQVASGTSHPGDGNWHFINVVKGIRPDATGEIWFRMNHHPESLEDVVYFDSAIAVVKGVIN
jgi:hypothetical protein